MGEKLVRKGRWGGQTGAGRRLRERAADVAKWRAPARRRGGQACRSSDRATGGGRGRARAGSGAPYSMPTTVARSGTVTRARAVVMNVPWAIVFASPWYW